jgi:hemoglobin
MSGLDLDEAGLATLVEAFYARVRADAQLGPIFNDAIGDWPEHLEKLAAFWSSVMLTSGRYKGQPVPAHVKHKSRITPALFDRWLALWAETTDALMTAPAAAALQDRARRIAQSLQLALFFRLDDQPVPRPAPHSSGATDHPLRSVQP